MGFGRWTGPRTAVVAAVLAAASIAAQPACKFMEQPKPRVYATAFVYSGRPNPSWSLSDSRTATLKRMMAALQPGGSAFPPPAPGYSGMAVDGASLVLDRCYSLRVFRGTIEANCDGGLRYLVDAGRQVERFIADSGLKNEDAGAYEVVIRDITNNP